MHTFKSRAGFTLIELMVVVIIIGILAGVAVQGYQAAQDRARNSSMITNVRTTFIGVESWRSDHGGGSIVPEELYGQDSNKAVAWGDQDSPVTERPPTEWPRYVPGGEVPKSPWADTPQTCIPAAQTSATLLPTIFFNEYFTGDKAFKREKDGSFADGRDFSHPGKVPAKGKGPQTFYDYGFIYYVGSLDTGRYGVFGVGKQGRNTICVAVRINF